MIGIPRKLYNTEYFLMKEQHKWNGRELKLGKNKGNIKRRGMKARQSS